MNSKHCPQCNSIITIKYGKKNGRMRYKCKRCNHVWSNKRREERRECGGNGSKGGGGKSKQNLPKLVWHDYVFNNMNIAALALKYGKSERTIRYMLHDYQVEPIIPKEPAPVIAMDVTYFGRSGGILTVLNAYTGTCLYCEETGSYETVWDYEKAILKLREYSIHPQAAVIDGRKGVREMLEEYNIKVQMCHFHQMRIIRQCLTRNPVLEPNIELKSLVEYLKHATEERFTHFVYSWRLKHLTWLNERVYFSNGKWEYSHKLTRRAINSLISNLPYLFTYEHYPELNIPKTNNLIEGVHSDLKRRLANHRGCGKTMRIKFARSFFSGRTETDNNP